MPEDNHIRCVMCTADYRDRSRSLCCTSRYFKYRIVSCIRFMFPALSSSSIPPTFDEMSIHLHDSFYHDYFHHVLQIQWICSVACLGFYSYYNYWVTCWSDFILLLLFAYIIWKLIKILPDFFSSRVVLRKPY